MGDRNSSIRNQERHWSRHAARYDDFFLDPFAPGVKNPLWDALAAVESAAAKTVADLGCGTGSLLPHLVKQFGKVVALDFSPAMLEQSRQRLGAEQSPAVRFLQRPMHELSDLAGQIDVAVMVNSLIMPDVRLIDRTLEAVYASLTDGGVTMGIVPSLDAIQYQTMLVYEQALNHGLTLPEAMRFTSHLAEHRSYDFAFGLFRFDGLRQKFWMPFEIEHRMGKAGFRGLELHKVLYPWDESADGTADLASYPPSWDWFFLAHS